MRMHDTLQTWLDELRTRNDHRTGIFDLHLQGLSDGTLSVSGRLLDQDQLAAVQGTFSDHFPDLSLDTTAVRILSRGSRGRAYVATNLTGLYDGPTLHLPLSSELC